MSELKNRIGEKHGRLAVIKRAEDFVCSSGRKVVMWECKCECGNICNVAATSLQRGATKSCGCLNLEKIKDCNIKYRKYKYKDIDLYERWHNIKKRCYGKNEPAYKNYGARGIKMCDEWLHNFEFFQNWALQNGYKKELTIDRIDNDGNYEPNNCRWATNEIQQNNKRDNTLITFDNETHTLSQWSEITHLNRSTISSRIDKLGWSIEDALTLPLQR